MNIKIFFFLFLLIPFKAGEAGKSLLLEKKDYDDTAPRINKNIHETKSLLWENLEKSLASTNALFSHIDRSGIEKRLAKNSKKQILFQKLKKEYGALKREISKHNQKFSDYYDRQVYSAQIRAGKLESTAIMTYLSRLQEIQWNVFEILFNKNE